MAEMGSVKIADEVVGIISSIAATEVEGVYTMSGGIVEGFAERLGKKALSKGVKVEVGEKETSVDVYLIVEYGSKIPQVAAKVQENIIKAVTTMTGLKVIDVNVFIQGIKMENDVEEEEVEDKQDAGENDNRN
ncbi:MAG: Asp23/Gls24 family envelope stress response protein [Fusobacteriota bacterium]